MLNSKQKVKYLCDKLMQVNPSQIVIDLVQDDIEELLTSENVTPDDIGSASYHCDTLLEVYNPYLSVDKQYLSELQNALSEWGRDAEFANRALGIDPNQ